MTLLAISFTHDPIQLLKVQLHMTFREANLIYFYLLVHLVIHKESHVSLWFSQQELERSNHFRGRA